MAKIFSQNHKIALTFILCTLVVLLALPPMHLGIIKIANNSSVTITHIPILLAIMLISLLTSQTDFSSLFAGFTVAITFGIVSMILAKVNPTGVLDKFFTNPLISIFPRVALACVSWFLLSILLKVKNFPILLTTALTAFISTLFHTMLVLATLYIFAQKQTYAAMGNKNYFAVIKNIFPNILVESIVAAIICTIIIAIVTSIFQKSNNKSNHSKRK